MIRPTACGVAALLLATGCHAAPAPTGPATATLHVRVAPAPARRLQGTVRRHLVADVHHWRATLARYDGEFPTALPDAAGVRTGDADDIYFTGLAGGRYRVEVTGEDAEDEPITLAAAAIVDLAAGGPGATATVAPAMKPAAFAGTIAMPALPTSHAWATAVDATVEPDDASVTGASTTYDPAVAGPHGFANLPVGAYTVTARATGGDLADEDQVRVVFDPDATSLETDATPAFTWGLGDGAPFVASIALEAASGTVVGLAASAFGDAAVATAGGDVFTSTGGNPFAPLATGIADLAPGLSYDAEGRLCYVAGGALRRTDGVDHELVAVLGADDPAFPAVGAEAFYVLDRGAGAILKVLPAADPPVSTAVAGLEDATSFALEADGSFVVGHGDGAVVRWSADGATSEPLVPAGRYGTDALVAADDGGYVYFCGTGDHAIYRVDELGEIRRLAGTRHVDGGGNGLDGRGDGATFGAFAALAAGTDLVLAVDASKAALRRLAFGS